MDNIQLDEKLVLLDLEGADKFDVITQMANNLRSNGYVKESYLQAIINREKVFATGLPTLTGGVAIPHTDIEHVKNPGISVARLKTPVDFVIMGDDSTTVSVNMVFMLAMKEQHTQLKMLQSLMEILQDGAALKFIESADTAAGVSDFIAARINA